MLHPCPDIRHCCRLGPKPTVWEKPFAVSKGVAGVLVISLWLFSSLMPAVAQSGPDQSPSSLVANKEQPAKELPAKEQPNKEAIRDRDEKALCLTSHEARMLVERGEVIALHKAIKLVRGQRMVEILKARLCPQQDRLIYLLTVLDKNSQISVVTLDARSGQIVSNP